MSSPLADSTIDIFHMIPDDTPDAMDATEPAFRSAKRRKIIPRKKSTDSGQESTGGSTGSSLAHRRPLTKKHGATFSSVSRGGAAPQASDGDEESAVVPFVQDVEVENERFMKPTGKVGVAEDKHMYVSRNQYDWRGQC